MISFDFAYYQPKSINDAVNTFENLKAQGKEVIYYAGGTEIISMARMNDLNFEAVIDIKGIPELNRLEIQNNRLIIGAGLTLTQICEANIFPLLTKAAKATADHTSRNRITVGGNICGLIPYREAVLPFLLCDSQAVLAGKNGPRTIPVTQIFNQSFQRDKGEILVQLLTDKNYLDMPHEFTKRTKMEEIDYPLVTLALLKHSGGIRAAFSGVCDFPFRSPKIEEDLNNKDISLEQRINNALSHLPGPLACNMQGSAGYRDFVFRNMLSDAVSRIGGVV